MDISIVIPVFNEASNISLLWERLSKVLDILSKDFECIFVNDGSSDDTLQKILDLSSENPQVKYIDFSRNFGHQIAVTAGLDHAKGEHIIIIDADLQDPPELIPSLLEKQKQGFDVVYAKRKSRKGESFFKKLTARYFYRILSRITQYDIPVDTGDFRIISRRVLDVLKQMPEQDKFLRGQISWLGFDQTYVEYERDERHSGKTGYSFRKMLHFALNGITGFSNVPLKIVTYMGFFVFFIALIVMMYSIYSWLAWEDTVPGWTSIMLSILFIGGIQMIAIGIIGEYLSRMNNNVRKRPLYIVRKKNTDFS